MRLTSSPYKTALNDSLLTESNEMKLDKGPFKNEVTLLGEGVQENVAFLTNFGHLFAWRARRGRNVSKIALKYRLWTAPNIY